MGERVQFAAKFVEFLEMTLGILLESNLGLYHRVVLCGSHPSTKASHVSYQNQCRRTGAWQSGHRAIKCRKEILPHHVHKSLEQIMRILGAGACFGVVLYREDGFALHLNAGV